MQATRTTGRSGSVSNSDITVRLSCTRIGGQFPAKGIDRLGRTVQKIREEMRSRGVVRIRRERQLSAAKVVAERRCQSSHSDGLRIGIRRGRRSIWRHGTRSILTEEIVCIGVAGWVSCRVYVLNYLPRRVIQKGRAKERGAADPPLNLRRISPGQIPSAKTSVIMICDPCHGD